MATDTQAASSVQKWLLRFGLVLGSLLLLMATLFVYGAYVPSTAGPVGYGSLALSIFPSWFIVVTLIAAVLIWRCGQGRFRAILLVVAAITVIGATNILYRLVSVAQDNDVEIKLADTFGFSGSLEEKQPDEVVVYTRDQGEDLTLRLFNPKGTPPQGGWPVIMHIHGGGWVSGSNAEQSADMRWFADRGWIVVSVGYSLSNPKRHLWSRVHDQLGCAMAWTNANIAARGGNANRLALKGGSAGGNLSLNAAFMANAGTLRSSCGGTIPRVQSVAPVYPGVDLVAIHNNPYPGTASDLRSMTERYTGGTPTQFPERYTAVANATHISTAAPPTLIFMSEHDHLVPLVSMQKFAAQIEKAGIPTQTISVPFAEHGFDISGIGNAIVRQATLKFIDEHAKLHDLPSRRQNPS